MTGKQEKKNGRCGICGGRMEWDENATIPFVFGRTVVIVREVPAEVCGSCGEAFMSGDVTDLVMDSVEKSGVAIRSVRGPVQSDFVN